MPAFVSDPKTGKSKKVPKINEKFFYEFYYSVENILIIKYITRKYSLLDIHGIELQLFNSLFACYKRIIQNMKINHEL